jgi:hypothetical protein
LGSLGNGGADQVLAEWVGIGGIDGHYNLAQIGTTESLGSPTNAWWEVLPASEMPIDMEVNAGDLICGEAAMAGYNLFGQQLWYMSLQDYSNGQYWDNWWDLDVCGGAIFWPSCSSVSLTSAEWIVETPQVNGQVTEPPESATVYFTSIAAKLGGSWQYVGGWPTPGASIMFDMLRYAGSGHSWYGASAKMAMWDGSMSAVEITGMSDQSNNSTLVDPLSFPPKTPGAVPSMSPYDYVSAIGGITAIQVQVILAYRLSLRRSKIRLSGGWIKEEHVSGVGVWLRRSSRPRNPLRSYQKSRKPQQPWPVRIPKHFGPSRVPILALNRFQFGGA